MNTGRWTRWVAAVAAAAAALVTAGLAAPAGAGQGVSVKRDVTYRTADGEQLGLDVYQPATKGNGRPAVVVIHGGAWVHGDKEWFAQQANQLAERGFVAFSVNYRLAPRTHTRPRSTTSRRPSNGCASTPRSTASTGSASARSAARPARISPACSPRWERARPRKATGSRRRCRGRARWTWTASPPSRRSRPSSGARPRPAAPRT